MKIPVVKNVLDANDRLAAENKALFERHKVYAINLMSSPGAGKTTLVEKTIDAMRGKYRIGVIEGDIQDTYDADRIARLGIPVVQINTGGACHIDGNMIREALPAFDLGALDLMIIENFGNLVCPAEFKIRENDKVMILSGSGKGRQPGKYPLMFQDPRSCSSTRSIFFPMSFDMDRARGARCP